MDFAAGPLRQSVAQLLNVDQISQAASQTALANSNGLIIVLHPPADFGTMLAVIGPRTAAIIKVSMGEPIPAFRPEATLCEGDEKVTAASWAAFDGSGTDSCLMIGTSSGWLRLYSRLGKLLMRQRLHSQPVVSINGRAGGQGIGGDSAGSDVTVMFPDSAARIDALELKSVIRLQHASWSDIDQLQPLSCTRWIFRSTGLRTDGICVGMRAPSLQALMKGPAATPSPGKMVVATVGCSPPFASFEVEENGYRGPGAFVADITTSLKGWLPSPLRHSRPIAHPLQFPAPHTAQAGGAVYDDSTRTATSFLLAPRGVLAAASDTLGRVMLVDVAMAAVVRIFKGYRDAQCCWLLLPQPSAHTTTRSEALHKHDSKRNKVERASTAEPRRSGQHGPSTGNDECQPFDEQSHSSPARQPVEPDRDSQQHNTAGFPKQAAADDGGMNSSGGEMMERALDQLLLVIYAPRKGVLDVFPVRHGKALLSLPCSSNCRLMQPPPVLQYSKSEARVQSDCLLLDFDTALISSVRQLVAAKHTLG